MVGRDLPLRDDFEAAPNLVVDASFVDPLQRSSRLRRSRHHSVASHPTSTDLSELTRAAGNFVNQRRPVRRPSKPRSWLQKLNRSIYIAAKKRGTNQRFKI
jgi:hypothetical protein